MFKVNIRNTRKRCDMFKVTNNDSRAMTSFSSSIDRGDNRFQANSYLFKFNNIDTRMKCGIHSKLTMKTPE